MSAAQVAVLVAALVLVSWMVGAYNRLVALRSAIGAALAEVVELQRRRGEALQQLGAALRAPLAAEHGTLEALAAAEAQRKRAAAALQQRPVAAPLAAALAGAEAALAAQTARLLALIEQHPSLAADDAVAPPMRALRDAEQRLPFARRMYNDAANAYDEAARQWPTSWLARLYGFGAAGRL
ncbi:MAG: LemA family protein [Rubrivivax sp.]|jgi:LemA protein|nr:LemA family protein [Rubrivivax sp.]